MKLTPIDIQQQQFRKTLRGLDPQEVHSFLELVSQQMVAQNRTLNELKVELRQCQRELEEHRDREATLKEAMLTAQRAIDEIREQAEKQAELIVAEADLKAEKLLLNAHKRVSAIIEDIQSLKAQRARVVEEIKSVVNTHLKLLEVQEEQRSDDNTKEATVTVLDRVRAPEPPRLENLTPGRERSGT